MNITNMREPEATAFRPRIWRLAHGRTLTLGPRGLLMAIINVTPDSFSDGGRFGNVEEVVEAARTALALGARVFVAFCQIEEAASEMEGGDGVMRDGTDEIDSKGIASALFYHSLELADCDASYVVREKARFVRALILLSRDGECKVENLAGRLLSSKRRDIVVENPFKGTFCWRLIIGCW